MASPPPRSFAAFWSWVFTLFVARPAVRDADSFASDRRSKGNEVVLDAGFGQAAQQAESFSVADADDEDDSERQVSRPSLILDSAARYHVTGDKSVLSKFATATLEGRTADHHTRDGRELPIAGAGTVTSKKFQLSDVLYAPGLLPGIVLVSVQQLAERGCLVMLGGGRCHVKDRSSGELLGQGRLHDDDGLYHLEFLRIPLSAAADGTETTVP